MCLLIREIKFSQNLISANFSSFKVYKIKATGLPSYLNNMLPKVAHHYQTQNSEDLATCETRTNIFKYSFFSYSFIEWNKRSSSAQNSTYPVFRNNLLKIIWPASNLVFL